MYSLEDYDSITAHPPLISWAFDGFDIYGRYLSDLSLGADITLDNCGGHTHDNMAYHYHAQVIETVTDDAVISMSPAGVEYTAYIGGVYKCWRGDIAQQLLFNNSVSLASRPDFEYLRPCCDMTEYYITPSVLSTMLFLNPTAEPTEQPTNSPVTGGNYVTIIQFTVTQVITKYN